MMIMAMMCTSVSSYARSCVVRYIGVGPAGLGMGPQVHLAVGWVGFGLMKWTVDNIHACIVGNVTTRTTSVSAETAASIQPASTPVTSRDGTATPGTIDEEFVTTLEQNTDFQHQSLVVIAGNSFSLHCSSPVEAKFRWVFCPFGSCKPMPSTIYNGNKINRKFHLADKVSVSDCSGRTCTFNANDFQLEDAGVFMCIRSGVKEYWSVTVLGKYRWNYLAICLFD